MLTMDNKVKCGRRLGQTKSLKSRVMESSKIQNLKASVVPGPNSLIFSPKEWQRIQNHITRKEYQEKIRLAKIEDREKLKQCSKDLVKNWNNTLMGYRKNRLESLELKNQKTEEERLKLDQEEAAYRAQKRDEVINRAKTLLYFEKDRVKRFHTALRYSKTLQEREAQIELKKLMEEAYKNKYEMNTVDLDREKKEFDNVIKAKAEERIRQRWELSQYHLKQIKEHEQNAEIANVQAYLDYQIATRDLEKFLKEEEILAFGRKMEKRKALQAFKDFTNSIDEELLTEETIDRIEDEKNEIFNNAMSKIARMKTEREKELKQEWVDICESVQKIEPTLAKKREREYALMLKHMTEENKKNNQMLRDRDAEHLNNFEEVFRFRLKQMSENEQRRRQEIEDKKLGREALESAFKRYEQKEREKFKRIRDEHIQLIKFREQQAEEHKEKKCQEIEASRKDLEDQFKDLHEEEKEFQNYTSGIIQSLEKQGVNVYPMKKVMQENVGGGLGPLLKERGGVRPSYLAAIGGRSQLIHLENDENKLCKEEIMGTMSTYTRLGFIW